MKVARFSLIIRHLPLIALASLVLALGGTNALAQTPLDKVVPCPGSAPVERVIWSSTGSAGVAIDEEDLNLYELDGATSRIRSTVAATAASPVVLDLAFNVPYSSEFINGATYKVKYRYRDPDTKGQIKAFFTKQDVSNGNNVANPTKSGFLNAVGSNLDFDSNRYAPTVQQPTTDTETVDSRLATPTWDFNRYTYFFNVQIIKTATGGIPSLTAIQIVRCTSAPSS